MTGYESYTDAELLEMKERFEKDLKNEEWVAEGNACLRCEIAKSTCRTYRENLAKIRETIYARSSSIPSEEHRCVMKRNAARCVKVFHHASECQFV